MSEMPDSSALIAIRWSAEALSLLKVSAGARRPLSAPVSVSRIHSMVLENPPWERCSPP